MIDLKVLVRSFNCESRACYVGNPRESISRMRSEGFPFNCGGLGAGGMFTRCFGPRPREGSMAGPLGNGAEGVRGGGEEGGRGAEGGPGGETGGGGWGWRGHSGSRIVLFFDFAKVIFFHESFAKVGYYNHYVKGCHPLPPGVRQEKGTREFRFVSGSVPCAVVLVDNHTLHR